MLCVAKLWGLGFQVAPIQVARGGINFATQGMYVHPGCIRRGCAMKADGRGRGARPFANIARNFQSQLWGRRRHRRHPVPPVRRPGERTHITSAVGGGGGP